MEEHNDNAQRKERKVCRRTNENGKLKWRQIPMHRALNG